MTDSSERNEICFAVAINRQALMVRLITIYGSVYYDVLGQRGSTKEILIPWIQLYVGKVQ